MALSSQHDNERRSVMPFLIPVLIGIPVLFGGGYVVYHLVHERKAKALLRGSRGRKPGVSNGVGLLRRLSYLPSGFASSALDFLSD
jgi:hypothetical protein